MRHSTSWKGAVRRIPVLAATDRLRLPENQNSLATDSGRSLHDAGAISSNESLLGHPLRRARGSDEARSTHSLGQRPNEVLSRLRNIDNRDDGLLYRRSA
jgi:hypothetical protein